MSPPSAASIYGGVATPGVPGESQAQGRGKIRAARCYTTQLDFQFGGPRCVGPTLSAVAAAEATRLGHPGAVEVLWGPVGRLMDAQRG